MTTTAATTARRLASPKEACAYAKICRTKLYQLVGDGRIRAFKLDRKTMVDLNSVDELLSTLPRVEPKAA